MPKAKVKAKTYKPNPEQEFELCLVVKLKGFGHAEHRMKFAARVKKIIQTSIGETPVWICEDDLLESSVSLKLTEVQLDDREALAGWDDPPRA